MFKRKMHATVLSPIYTNQCSVLCLSQYVELLLDQLLLLLHRYNGYVVLFVLNPQVIQISEVQLDTLQNLWVGAVFMTLVNTSLSYQKIINMS